MMEENVTQDILSALDKLFPDGFVETCIPILSDGAASQYSTQCLQIGTVIVEAGKLATLHHLFCSPQNSSSFSAFGVTRVVVHVNLICS